MDPRHCNAWIAKQTGHDLLTVQKLMWLQFEYEYGVGIIDMLGGPPPTMVFYTLEELHGLPRFVDSDRLAQDAQERAGIDSGVAHEIFEAEMRYLDEVERP